MKMFGLAATAAVAWIAFLLLAQQPHQPSICDNLAQVADDMADVIKLESATLAHLDACKADAECAKALETVRQFGLRKSDI